MFDAVEGARLPLPSRVVGEPIVGQRPIAPHLGQVDLDLGVAGLGFLDEAANRGLIEHLPHGHRLALVDDREQSLASFLDFGLGRAVAFYGASLISGGGHGAPLTEPDAARVSAAANAWMSASLARLRFCLWRRWLCLCTSGVTHRILPAL